MKQLLLIICVAGFSSLWAMHMQPETTPQIEEEIVEACGKKTAAPLSETLELLVHGISNEIFDKNFIDKIAQAEANQFTGEYLDYWENGQLKIKAYFKSGKVDGHVHGWFPHGQEAFKAFFYENTKVGTHMAFFDGGPSKPDWTVRFARLFNYNYDGQLDGEQESSFRKGGKTLKTLARYKHGLLHGSRLMYTQTRERIRDEFYQEGELVPGVHPEQDIIDKNYRQRTSPK